MCRGGDKLFPRLAGKFNSENIWSGFFHAFEVAQMEPVCIKMLRLNPNGTRCMHHITVKVMSSRYKVRQDKNITSTYLHTPYGDQLLLLTLPHSQQASSLAHPRWSDKALVAQCSMGYRPSGIKVA